MEVFHLVLFMVLFTSHYSLAEPQHPESPGQMEPFVQGFVNLPTGMLVAPVGDITFETGFAQCPNPAVPVGPNATYGAEMSLSSSGSGYVLTTCAPMTTIPFSSSGGVFVPQVPNAAYRNLDVQSSPGFGLLYFEGQDDTSYLKFDLTSHHLREAWSKGTKTTYSYNTTSNTLGAITDSAGNMTTFSYGSNGLLYKVTGPDMKATTYLYGTVNKDDSLYYPSNCGTSANPCPTAPSGALTEIDGPAAPLYKISWNRMTVTGITDEQSLVTTNFSYYSDGSLAGYADNYAGSQTGSPTLIYFPDPSDASNTLLLNSVVFNLPWEKTTYQFISTGLLGWTRISKKQNPDGSTELYNYSGDLLTSSATEIGSGTFTQLFAYADPTKYRATQITKGGTVFANLSYDSLRGIVTGYTDKAGYSETTTLNALGQPAQRKTGLDINEIYSYDGSNFLSRVNVNGLITAFVNDSLTGLHTQVTENGLTTVYKYGDQMGFHMQLLEVDHPDGSVTSYDRQSNNIVAAAESLTAAAEVFRPSYQYSEVTTDSNNDPSQAGATYGNFGETGESSSDGTTYNYTTGNGVNSTIYKSASGNQKITTEGSGSSSTTVNGNTTQTGKTPCPVGPPICTTAIAIPNPVAMNSFSTLTFTPSPGSSIVSVNNGATPTNQAKTTWTTGSLTTNTQFTATVAVNGATPPVTGSCLLTVKVTPPTTQCSCICTTTTAMPPATLCSWQQATGGSKCSTCSKTTPATCTSGASTTTCPN